MAKHRAVCNLVSLYPLQPSLKGYKQVDPLDIPPCSATWELRAVLEIRVHRSCQPSSYTTRSILTRAFTRVQLFAGKEAMCKITFQSSLELSPECNLKLLGILKDRFRVSILTRAFTRVQQRFHHYFISCNRFQSSLELSPECNAGYISAFGALMDSFNPHSSFHPSATASF